MIKKKENDTLPPDVKMLWSSLLALPLLNTPRFNSCKQEQEKDKHRCYADNEHDIKKHEIVPRETVGE